MIIFNSDRESPNFLNRGASFRWSFGPLSAWGQRPSLPRTPAYHPYLIVKAHSSWFRAFYYKSRYRPYIDLSGNPWSCECSMISFRAWADRNKWFLNIDGFQGKINPKKIDETIDS